MAKLEPKPLPCPQCGKKVNVRLTGWGLQNWFELIPECGCFPKMVSKHYWIDGGNHVSDAENAYKEMTEEWNRMVKE